MENKAKQCVLWHRADVLSFLFDYARKSAFWGICILTFALSSTYKKLLPPISAFINNSLFGNNKNTWFLIKSLQTLFLDLMIEAAGQDWKYFEADLAW